MRSFVLVAVLLSVLAVSGRAQTVRVTSNSPPEAKLAAIDQGTTSVERRLVNTYAILLDRLDAKCPEDRPMVGDIAVKGTQLLEDNKGVEMSILRFLRAMDEAIPEEASRVLKCTEIAAALVTMIDRP